MAVLKNKCFPASGGLVKKKKTPMNFPAPHQESICLLHHSSTHILLYQMQNTPAGLTKAHVLCTVARGNKPIPTAGGNSLKQSGNSNKFTQQHRGEQLIPPQHVPTDRAYKPQPCRTHCRDFGIGADRSLEDFTRSVEAPNEVHLEPNPYTKK